MRLCVIESPFEGGTEREQDNRAYLNRCIRDAIERGEVPFASHKMYVDSLDDTTPEERERGMQLGHEMLRALRYTAASAKDASLVVAVYTNRGLTRGMKTGIEYASTLGVRIEFRAFNEPNDTEAGRP